MSGAVSSNDIALSGIQAQRLRMNLIANNIANVMTTRTRDGGAFRRQMAIFRGEQQGALLDPSGFGVRVTKVIEDESPFRVVFDPAHPDANADGYVNYPNVNLAVEMVDLVTAQRAYEANINVILSGKRMSAKALEILTA